MAFLALLGWSAPAAAEEYTIDANADARPLDRPGDETRVHFAAGGAHALGGTHSSEFGLGGAGRGTVELPVTPRLGVQASAGALVLSKGFGARETGATPTPSAGAAFMGTFGVRLRANGTSKVAGPWIDGNIGVAHTGNLTRPAFDAHLGWDVRVARSSRVDVGPYLGYTQILQPDSEPNGNDVRVLTVGLSVSLGAKERARPAEPPAAERPSRPAATPPPPPVVAQEEIEEEAPAAIAQPLCKDGAPPTEDGCGDGIRVYEDRIILTDVVHFKYGSTGVDPRSRHLVRNIARYIAQHPDITDISIEGHADGVGSDEYNNKLSEARAMNMKRQLVYFGVASSRLRIVGHGKAQPKVDTPRPEVQNRRVELFVTRKHVENIAASHGRSAR